MLVLKELLVEIIHHLVDILYIDLLVMEHLLQILILELLIQVIL